MRMVLLGAPGAGKGSLAAAIKDKLGIAHLSSGDILREEMKKGSALGLEIKGLIEKGALVSDEMITKLVELKVSGELKGTKGYILDGFPRTVHQAKDLDRILNQLGEPLDLALCMEAKLDTVLMRLSGRRVCRKCGALFHIRSKKAKKDGVCDLCGGELYQRSDDNEETIAQRMKVYETSTKPIIEYYASQGKLKTIDANQETIIVANDLIKMINEDKSYQNQRS